MDKSLRDLEYVRFFTNDNQGSLFWSTMAFAGAIEIARREGRAEDTNRYLQQGRFVAEKLAAIQGYPAGDYGLWLFYRATGENASAALAIRRVGQFPGDYCLFFAADLLRQEDMVAAVDEFDKVTGQLDNNGKYISIARAHLVRDLPDGCK